jgi:pimeloyl-ACP methyl ester carboxylesterase
VQTVGAGSSSTQPGEWSDCGSVSDVPETRFTHSADGTRLAYQVTGEGPLNLVFLREEAMPLDLMWDDPLFVRLSKRLGRFSRSVWEDPRGVGASEGEWLATVLRREADVLAVIDAAVGSEPVALLGWGPAGVTAIQISVMHPERVSALVLVNSFAHYVRADDYPWGIPRASLDRLVAASQAGRDTGAALGLLAPSRSADEGFERGGPEPSASASAPSGTARQRGLPSNGMSVRCWRRSRSPPWSCTENKTATSASAPANTWRSTSPGLGSWCSPAPTTRTLRVTSMRSQTRSRSS